MEFREGDTTHMRMVGSWAVISTCKHCKVSLVRGCTDAMQENALETKAHASSSPTVNASTKITFCPSTSPASARLGHWPPWGGKRVRRGYCSTKLYRSGSAAAPLASAHSSSGCSEPSKKNRRVCRDPSPRRSRQVAHPAAPRPGSAGSRARSPAAACVLACRRRSSASAAAASAAAAVC